MNHPLLYNAFCEDDVASGDRHITFDDKGVLCMTVVDPVTRKLLIPLNHVYPTRAQQRTTIPSLCQLFLNGRCRQGAQCHQVHASPDMVTVLRSQVETLPRCCALHGDRDYVGVMDDQSWVSRVVVHVADAAYEGGYIPLSRFSYTIPVRNMLKDLNTRCRSGCPGELVAIDDGPRKWMVLNTHEVKLCELHILDRCRYAEECIFLHICKELTSSISGTSADATTTTPLPHVKKDKEGRAGKKSSIFVSISRQQRVCGAPLFYSASEPPEPHYAWAYGAAASNNSASDVNSDSFKAVGCYPIDTAEMGSKRPEAPFPVQQCLAHVQQKARRQSATTPSMTAAASSGDEGAVDSGGSRSFFSLPEQGGLRAATGCANVGYHPYIHNDCHCADCIGYYSSNGCGCCEYCVVNDYGLDSYGQYNYVIDDRHCTSQAAAVGSPSVQHPAAVFLSGRSWHHNPYGSGLKNGAVF